MVRRLNKAWYGSVRQQRSSPSRIVCQLKALAENYRKPFETLSTRLGQLSILLMHLLIARRVLDMCELVMTNQEMQHKMFVQGAYFSKSLISLYYHMSIKALADMAMVMYVAGVLCYW